MWKTIKSTVVRFTRELGWGSIPSIHYGLGAIRLLNRLASYPKTGNLPVYFIFLLLNVLDQPYLHTNSLFLTSRKMHDIEETHKTTITIKIAWIKQDKESKKR